MKREYYDEETMLKEAITSQKTDQEIAMPDIEAELTRVKQRPISSNPSSLSSNPSPLSSHLSSLSSNLSSLSSHPSPLSSHLAWRRIAAIAIIVITISGLSWAFVYYQNNKSAEATPVEQPAVVENVSKIATEQQKDSIPVKASDNLTLSYDKASLEQIIIDLSTYYHLDKPVFADQMAARKYKMHITFDQKGTINDAIDLLNNFGSVQVSLEDNKLMVK